MKDERYAHRLNDDGSFDSICLHCFQTIATAETEEELNGSEDSHKCSEIIVDAQVTHADRNNASSDLMGKEGTEQRKEGKGVTFLRSGPHKPISCRF